MSGELILHFDKKEYSKDVLKKWHSTITEVLPSGILVIYIRDDKQIIYSKIEEKNQLSIICKLSRNLTEIELKRISEKFNNIVDFDITVTCPTDVKTFVPTIELDIPEDELLTLATKWKKDEHDLWMKNKSNDGWVYGTKLSSTNKTHPMLRKWSDLPDFYKKADSSKLNDIVELMNKHGYVFVKKSDIDIY